MFLLSTVDYPQCLFMSNFLYDISYPIAYYSTSFRPHFISASHQQQATAKPFFNTLDWPLNLSLSTSTHLAQLFIKWENEKRAFVCNNVCVCSVWCCSISWRMNLWEYIQKGALSCAHSHIYKRKFMSFYGYYESEQNRTQQHAVGTGETFNDNML